MRTALHPTLLVIVLACSSSSSGLAAADKLDAASIPVGAVYVCVTGADKDRKFVTIGLPEKVADLCRRHTEMGPCKSARNECRKSGGRVYAADGTEITSVDEAAFDKKVMRTTVGQ